jgi:hypothetical protein
MHWKYYYGQGEFEKDVHYNQGFDENIVSRVCFNGDVYHSQRLVHFNRNYIVGG